MANVLAIAQPALIGLGVLALPVAANALVSYLRVQKLLPIIRRSFTVIDPLLNEHLSGYSGSDIRFAMELVTGVLADGQLNAKEVRQAVNEIERRYRPSKAAGKTSASLKAAAGSQSVEAKLLEAVAGVADRRELLPKNLLDAVNVVRLKIL